MSTSSVGRLMVGVLVCGLVFLVGGCGVPIEEGHHERVIIPVRDRLSGSARQAYDSRNHSGMTTTTWERIKQGDLDALIQATRNPDPYFPHISRCFSPN
jgi:hypothetical protein